MNNTVNNREACLNLIAAVFEQTNHDWVSACKKKAKLGKYTEQQYEKDRCILKSSNTRQLPEYKEAKNRTDVYISCEKMINNILLFFQSNWFVTICNGCELDPDAIKDQFNSIKDSILDNAV